MRLAAVIRARLASVPAAAPAFALLLPWQCNLLPPPPSDGGAPAAVVSPAGGTRSAEAAAGSSRASAAVAKQEAPSGRVSSAPPRVPPVRTITLPDEVVVKALAAGQPAFLRCWARAQRADGLSATKVHLHIELDASGKVTATQSDSESPALSTCLTVVARRLAFPAPGRAAIVDLPLMFP